MKHETINSILGGLGLLIALVTAWFQFAPTADQLQVVSEGRIDFGTPVEVKNRAAFDTSTGKSQPVIGPVVWKIRVHNEADQVVSIVDWQIFLIASDGRLTQYSSMQENLSALDRVLTPISLPINIPANETTAYYVSAHVPFDRDVFETSECFEPARGLRQTENCVILGGKDLFGNSVFITKYDPTFPNSFSVTWESVERTPQFFVRLETADGSNFSVFLSYLPEF